MYYLQEMLSSFSFYLTKRHNGSLFCSRLLFVTLAQVCSWNNSILIFNNPYISPFFFPPRTYLEPLKIFKSFCMLCGYVNFGKMIWKKEYNVLHQSELKIHTRVLISRQSRNKICLRFPSPHPAFLYSLPFITCVYLPLS